MLYYSHGRAIIDAPDFFPELFCNNIPKMQTAGGKSSKSIIIISSNEPIICLTHMAEGSREELRKFQNSFSNKTTKIKPNNEITHHIQAQT